MRIQYYFYIKITKQEIALITLYALAYFIDVEKKKCQSLG